MAKKKNNQAIIYNIETFNTEIDYEKLEETIVKALIKIDEQKELHEKQKTEELEKEALRQRFKALGCENDFDENGNPKTKVANLKIVWKFLWAKESFLKEIKTIDFCVNSIVAFFFSIIEKLLYFVSFGLFVFGIANIFQFTTSLFQFAEKLNYPWHGTMCIIIAITLFFFTRTIIRAMKIDCKYNEDSNYMLNFLAVIIAVMAIIVSIFA